MILIYCVLAGMASIYLLWTHYLAVMNLKRVKDSGELSKPALYLGYPLFLIGYTIDILVNIFVMSFLFLEVPQETTVTARLKRHIYLSTGWRESLAAWFCSNLLNPFDPSGSHCGRKK